MSKRQNSRQAQQREFEVTVEGVEVDWQYDPETEVEAGYEGLSVWEIPALIREEMEEANR